MGNLNVAVLCIYYLPVEMQVNSMLPFFIRDPSSHRTGKSRICIVLVAFWPKCQN